MRGQARENVVAVLPYRLGDDERCIDRDIAKNFHAVFLAVDEAVALFLVEAMGALDREAFLADDRNEGFFHGILRGLAGLVGRGAKVAADDEIDGFVFCGRHRGVG